MRKGNEWIKCGKENKYESGKGEGKNESISKEGSICKCEMEKERMNQRLKGW